MRRELAIAVTMIAGCGTRQTSASTLSNKAPATLAGPSCKDAGVILRARVANEDTAGPDKEATIASACETDHWPSEVITCVTSNPHPRNCLEGLSEAARASYDAKLEAWAAKWSEDLDQGDQVAAIPEPLECGTAIGDPASYAPAIALVGEDRELVIKMRHDAIVKQCDAGWTEDVKQCLQAATDPAAVGTCTSTLDPQQVLALAGKLSALDLLMAKIIGTRAKAPDCKKLVASHYADAAWKSKLDTVKGADRKKMIESSRKVMIEACTKDAWSPTLRACVSGGGGQDCFAGERFAWGFPARGVIVPTGIAECDAYITAIQSYATCAKLPQDARDAIAQSIEEATHDRRDG